MRSALCLCLIVAAGCDGLKTATRPTPPPRPSARPEPKTVPLRHAAAADRLVLMIGSKPRDTDGNGYPDSLDLTAMLFEGPGGDPVLVPGWFEFELQPVDESIQRPWRRWTMDEATTASAAGPALFNLPGYAFTLDLRDNGGERFESTSANVVAAFHPAAGGRSVVCAPEQRIVRCKSPLEMRAWATSKSCLAASCSNAIIN